MAQGQRRAAVQLLPWGFSALLAALTLLLRPGAGVTGQEADTLRSAQELIRLGDQWLAADNLDAAERCYRQALRLDNRSIAAWRGLGRIEARRGRWDEASSWFSKIEDASPEDVEAHYYLGIHERESGKFKGPLLRQLDFRSAEKHFRKVLEKDSLYSDIWYQMALLERFREDYLEAVDLAYKQITLKPTLVGPRVGIFRLLDLYIEHNDSLRVFTELTPERYGWYATFFRAEKLRRLGHLDSARAAFERLLLSDPSASATAIHLRLARIAFERGDDQLGQQHYWDAIQSIRNGVDGELAFSDVKYILTDDEYRRWLDAPLLSHKKAFFSQVWASRDPFPGSADNPRLVEHYRRLIYAEKWYRQDEPHRPFHALDLTWGKVPSVFARNEEFHQKGLVYIRWGKPDDKSIFTGQGYPTYEAWVYRRTAHQPQIIVHFANAEDASPNDWRISRLPPPEVVWSMGLESWDTRYHSYISSSSAVEQLALAEELERELREASRHLLTEERMVFPDTVQFLPAYFYWSTFKGEDGGVELNFYYGVAFADAFDSKEPLGLRRFFESGIAVFDTLWNEVGHRLRRFPLVKSKETAGAVATDAQTFHLQPGVFRLSFFVRDESRKRIGSWRFLDTLEAYQPGLLQISDLTLAVDVGPDLPLAPGRFRRQGLVVAPNPTRTFSARQPIHVYYEVYNLSRDEQGVGRCRVTYTLDPREKKRTGFLGLFGPRRGAVSVTTEFESDKSDIPLYAALDVSPFGAGALQLRVDVVDLRTGRSASKSIPLQLIRP
ncbi:MAG: tetratricopeptide repeat protein [candidate division KSB1 bacterium]|nr:tetratricopeptide repeat protein [candidate division KSB1 bacterium]